MASRLTTEEVNKRDGEIGLIPLEPYIGSAYKRKYRCLTCGKTIINTPNIIWIRYKKDCGRCQYPDPLLFGGRKKDIRNQKFGMLTAIEPLYMKKHRVIWRCVCDCGNNKNTSVDKLVNGHVKSCGKCNYKGLQTSKRNRINIQKRRFGSMVALRPLNINKHGGVIWECVCDCGNTCKLTTARLLSGGTKSCGSCQLRINGQTTSKISLSLKSLLIPWAVHNYHYGKPNPYNGTRKSVDWAFVYDGKKIAVEYDEWYWHGYKRNQDNLRNRTLIELGWYIIIIRASYNRPTQHQINKALDLIKSGKRKVIIKLKGWNVGTTFADRKRKSKPI